MKFLLVDIGMALAASLVYWTFVVLARHRAEVVTLARGVTGDTRANRARGHGARTNRHIGTPKPRVTYLDISGVDPRRLVNLR
jgi:hypothetical protein